ncbi:pilus assembly protein [Amphritea japonica]|nr:PilC/PilY family type IV pilus protein [Amphritea japonica]
MNILSKIRISIFAGGLVVLATLSASVSAVDTSLNYTGIPPFLAAETGQPNIVIAMDISGSMKAVAYADTGAGNWKSGLHDDFNPAKRYYGYFDSEKKYRYNLVSGVFLASGDLTGAGNIQGTLLADEWNGNFLNWMAMRRIDVIRKVMVGGKVESRDSASLNVIDGQPRYVLLGQHEPYDYSFRKAYTGSSAFTPTAFANSTEFLINEGMIDVSNGASASAVPLGDHMELGQVTMDWTNGDSWKSVSYTNTYTNPIVVALAVSYNGGDPVESRVKSVTASGFKIRMQEHDYKDGNHTTEDIVYLVAEKGQHTLTLSDSSTVNVFAGERSTDKTWNDGDSFITESLTGFASTPRVFTGISSNNSSRPVHTRVKNISASSFKMILQNEEDYTNDHPSNEDIHYIAIDNVAAGSTLDTGVILNVSSIGSVRESWKDVDLSANGFSSVPFFGAAMQTTNDPDPANVRYGDSNPTASIIDIQIDEEQSANNERSHSNETVGYIAATGAQGFRIRVAIDSEPTGVIQDNAQTMRFGLAVYNYDHTTKTPTNLYNGNSVHGSTFWPCYPDTSKPVSLRTTYDTCIRTDIRYTDEDPDGLYGDEANIVEVIEDHPLIWGTTPIAETLYDIWGYYGQGNISTSAPARPGNTAYYDPKSTKPAYEVNSDWDPYYFADYGRKLNCAKSFVLHFNDGAPYTDWNGSGVHPVIETDGVGAIGQNQALDDVAWNMRKYDCRDEAGMSTHQEIVSYYVYAALGEGELNNTSTTLMREAAANGGFYDEGVGAANASGVKPGEDDHIPTPKHPVDFKSYFQQILDDPTFKCDVNEWDQDGDCNPDTFYMADDGEALVSQLNAALASILRRSSSGGAASVVASSTSGEGAIYTALFQNSRIKGNEEVAWVGNVYAMMVDNAGYMRVDGNGDRTLGGFADDPIVDMCFDEADQLVRVKLSTSKALRPTSVQSANCEIGTGAGQFGETLQSLEDNNKYLWQGATWLNTMTDSNTQVQRNYTNLSQQRHIITGIDSDRTTDNLMIHNAEAVDFIPASFSDDEKRNLLGVTAAEVTDLVNWVRGENVSGYRSRAFDGDTLRLGDVIYSVPTVVGAPAEAIDLLYNDSSYLAYKRKWKNRRNVLYVGGNDGMLHAFNAGWFNSATKKFYKGPPTPSSTAGNDSTFELGSEMWAYIPQAMLPHLKYLAAPSYGAVGGNHIYGVDLTPRVFDAQIFTPDSTHTSGWGTVLVGGMRLGGGGVEVDHDNDSTTPDRRITSSYFVFDVTDPESAPKLMLEFTDADLGFTLSRPSPLRVKYSSANDKWYLMLSSGPTNNPAGFLDVKSTSRGALYLLDLDYTDNLISLETDFGTGGKLALADATYNSSTIDNSTSFISEPVVVDYDLDAAADAVYFGTVTGDPSGWGGDLFRIQIEDSGGYLPVTSWATSLLTPIGKPVSSKPGVGLDYRENRWVYTGTGRFYTREDTQDTTVHTYYGIKEPRVTGTGNTSGNLTWAVSDDLVDVSNAKVQASNGSLTGVSGVSGLTSGDNQKKLEAILAQYKSDTASLGYYHGWKKDLGAGNKIIGSPALLGGTLTYTGYEPIPDACEYKGTSRLYVLNYITGTANASPIIGTYDESGTAYVATVIEVGSAPAVTPSLHRGSGYTDADGDGTSAFVNTADGKTIRIEQDNEGSIYSGEMSWRKLFGE